MKFIVSLLIASLLLVISCSSDEPVITNCVAKDGITPVCKFKNPEDAVVLPNGKLIVSQMGDLQEKSPGSLTLFNIEDVSVTPLFGHGYSPDGVGDNSWGNTDCKGNPRKFLSPHGISLIERADKRLQLMVVNHGGRESIEFFEVVLGEPRVSIIWRGCVLAPNKEFFNDVVGLADGGFIVSSMYSTRGPTIFGLHLGGYKALLGMDSGYLSEWHPWQEMTVVAGSHGAFPNGLALSKDGRYIYQNLYGANEVRKLDRRSGEVLATASVVKPDNTTVDARGRLLVASQKISLLELKSCLDRLDESCLLPFEIVQIDPETMESKVVFQQEGPPMGTGTVAVQHNNNLVIGSFIGDRMILTDYVAE